MYDASYAFGFLFFILGPNAPPPKSKNTSYFLARLSSKEKERRIILPAMLSIALLT